MGAVTEVAVAAALGAAAAYSGAAPARDIV